MKKHPAFEVFYHGQDPEDGREFYSLHPREGSGVGVFVEALPDDTPTCVPLYYCQECGHFDCVHALFMGRRAKKKPRRRS